MDTSFLEKDITVETKNRILNTKLWLLAFDDESNHWQQARRDWDTSTCEQKKAFASYSHPVALTFSSTKQPIEYKVNIVEKLRPRFWYFAVVDCGMSFLQPMDYTLHLQNFELGWQNEFSWDHTSMLELYSVFCGAFFILGIYCYVAAWKQEIHDHPLLRLLSLTHALSVASTLSFAAYYGIFLQNGEQRQHLRFIGVLSSTMTMSTFFLTIMLIGEGWAEVKGFACSIKDKRDFFQAVFVLAGACTFCEIHSEFLVDQSTKLYNYQSVPGVLVLVIKIAMFSWFLHSTRKTLGATQGHQDRTFYKVLLWTLTIWFLSVPVTVIFAWFLDPWYRYKLVTVVDYSSRFTGQVLLSLVLVGSLSPICNLDTKVSSGHPVRTPAISLELEDNEVKLLQGAKQAPDNHL